MNELIKVTTNLQGERVVSARSLYEFLEVKTEFPKWCTRMFEYGFEENKDYSLVKIGERSIHNKIDYVLTLDTAKEISMLQRSDKGKIARQYFIECEKQLNKAILLPSYQIDDPIQRAKTWILEQEEKQLLLQQNNELRPKAEFAEAVLQSDDVVDMNTVAKVLNLPFGRNTLFKELRERKVLMQDNKPYQVFCDKGWFRLVESKFVKNGETHVNFKTVVFQRGIQGIRQILQ